MTPSRAAAFGVPAAPAMAAALYAGGWLPGVLAVLYGLGLAALSYLLMVLLDRRGRP